MKKMTGTSMDLTQDNIGKLQQLFPEVFTEGRINYEKLRLVLGDDIENKEERYAFTWHGKAQSMRLAQTPTLGTLRPDKTSSKAWNETNNVYIEGDNLEVLKLLQIAYFGKIKTIYIDPPYNTGNDFVYKDDFKDNIQNYKSITGQATRSNPETSGRYHTDWLNMMYPRLKLARNLLIEDGLIFISIDENEIVNLRKMCDEIFGEENFVSQIIVQSNKRGQTYKDIAKTHEYLLIYSKSGHAEIHELPKTDGQLPFTDEKGPFDLWELRNRNPKFGRHNRPNLYFPIFVSPSLKDGNGYHKISLQESKEFSNAVYPKNSEGKDSCWRWSKDKIKSTDICSPTAVLIAKQRRDGEWNIYEKSRKATTKPKSIWDETDVINEQGTIELGVLGLASYFDHPKPLGLIKKILYISTDADSEDIVLDFFSGSSTVADAIIQLNAEDGGNRRFIMVQLPEALAENSDAHNAGFNNICEIAKERIRRAGDKIIIETEKRELDTGFKVFKLDSSNLKRWDSEFGNLEEHLFAAQYNILEGRSQGDLLYEIMIKQGISLNAEIREVKIGRKTLYDIGRGALLIFLEDNIDLRDINEIVKQKSSFMDSKVVFRDSGFADDTVKTNAIQILKQAGIKEDHVRSV